MKIINEDGNEWVNLPLQQKTLITAIAVFLKDYFPNKTALLLHPTISPHTTIDTAKKFNVDIILQDQAHHCVDLSEPAFSNNWEIPFYYLTNNFEEFYNPRHGLIFYPYWLIKAQSFFSNTDIGSHTDIHRTYLASSICRHPRIHRIYNFIKLRKMSFFSKTFWTFYKCDHIQIEQPALVSNLEWQQFEQYYNAAESIFGGEEQCIEDTNWEAFADSYINLTSETYLNYSFASEKSFKPFLAGQIPVIYGAPGANKLLADIGFDMFYDIIDHNEYDFLPTVEKRIEKMLSLVDKVSTYNFSEIFKETEMRRKKNRDYLCSKEVLDLLLTPLFNILKK